MTTSTSTVSATASHLRVFGPGKYYIGSDVVSILCDAAYFGIWGYKHRYQDGVFSIQIDNHYDYNTHAQQQSESCKQPTQVNNQFAIFTIAKLPASNPASLLSSLSKRCWYSDNGLKFVFPRDGDEQDDKLCIVPESLFERFFSIRYAHLSKGSCFNGHLYTFEEPFTVDFSDMLQRFRLYKVPSSTPMTDNDTTTSSSKDDSSETILEISKNMVVSQPVIHSSSSSASTGKRKRQNTTTTSTSNTTNTSDLNPEGEVYCRARSTNNSRKKGNKQLSSSSSSKRMKMATTSKFAAATAVSNNDNIDVNENSSAFVDDVTSNNMINDVGQQALRNNNAYNMLVVKNPATGTLKKKRGRKPKNISGFYASSSSSSIPQNQTYCALTSPYGTGGGSVGLYAQPHFAPVVTMIQPPREQSQPSTFYPQQDPSMMMIMQQQQQQHPYAQQYPQHLYQQQQLIVPFGSRAPDVYQTSTSSSAIKRCPRETTRLYSEIYNHPEYMTKLDNSIRITFEVFYLKAETSIISTSATKECNALDETNPIENEETTTATNETTTSEPNITTTTTDASTNEASAPQPIPVLQEAKAHAESKAGKKWVRDVWRYLYKNVPVPGVIVMPHLHQPQQLYSLTTPQHSYPQQQYFAQGFEEPEPEPEQDQNQQPGDNIDISDMDTSRLFD